jgi:hypothetical protein
LVCCADCDDAPNTVDLIDNVSSGYELPEDIIIEEIIMKPIITPATETPTVATRATKPKGDEEEQNEEEDEADDNDEDKVDEVQPEEEVATKETKPKGGEEEQTEDDEVVHDEEVEGAEVDEKDCDEIELQDNDGGKLAMVGAGVGDVPKGANSLTTTWVLGLLALMSWLLAIRFARTKETVNREKASLSEHSTTDEQDKREYFVCKIKTERGEIMSKNDKVPLSKNMVKTYQSGVGKLFHMMNRSRHGVLHRVRELSRFMSSQMDAHLSRKYKVLKYVKHTASLRKILKPNAVWDGVNKSFEMDNEAEGAVNREEVVIVVPWISNNLMSSDICTKNIGGSDFARHRDVYVRDTP